MASSASGREGGDKNDGSKNDARSVRRPVSTRDAGGRAPRVDARADGLRASSLAGWRSHGRLSVLNLTIARPVHRACAYKRRQRRRRRTCASFLRREPFCFFSSRSGCRRARSMLDVAMFAAPYEKNVLREVPAFEHTGGDALTSSYIISLLSASRYRSVLSRRSPQSPELGVYVGDGAERIRVPGAMAHRAPHLQNLLRCVTAPFRSPSPRFDARQAARRATRLRGVPDHARQRERLLEELQRGAANAGSVPSFKSARPSRSAPLSAASVADAGDSSRSMESMRPPDDEVDSNATSFMTSSALFDIPSFVVSREEERSTATPPSWYTPRRLRRGGRRLANLRA